VTGVFTTGLQRLHTGILPTYVTWCLLGAMVLFFLLLG
jgi:hypothetical protein